MIKMQSHLCLKKDIIINNFIELSKIVGPERVIWRCDPIFISDKYTLKYLLKAFEKLLHYYVVTHIALL